MTAYRVYDVFTDAPFGGNPLAVILDATALPEPHLQKIAREFNFSETVFLYPPENGETARLRIITPTMEVPFAGHPTIGAAGSLSEDGHGPAMILRLGIGPLEVTAAEGAAEFRVTRPFETLGNPAPDLVARCLSLPATAIAAPPVHGGVGLDFVLVELADRAELSACRPVTEAFRDGAAAHPSGLDFAVCAYVRDGSTVDMRMFAPLDLIPEDPATGSAAAALTAYLAQREGIVQLDIRQGDDMGRPSRITTRADDRGVTVAGRAVRVMEGRLTI
jgi:trans-2,3-dihydro-3-hydroxyanthranilate isomerase